MVLRHSLGRTASRAVRSPFQAPRRGLAAPASGSFQYQTGESAGVKHASRELAGPTATLALVSKAGSRYQPLPGLAEGLEKYAYRNTEKRSALRIQRESELFGAQLFSYHTRESVVIGAKFFRDDLPYFAELLAEVAEKTKYLDYEFTEQVIDQVHRSQVKQLGNTVELSHASAHGLAFHRGLGEPLYPSSSLPLSKYLTHDTIGAYSTVAYRKSNVAVVGNGVDSTQLSKWVGEYFGGLRTEPAAGVLGLVEEGQTKYYGGEERIAHGSGNTITLAFPGSSTITGGFYKPEVSVLAALLGGESNIKWSAGFSALGKVAAGRTGLTVKTKSNTYSDAGLLTVTLNGPARAVAEGASDAVQIIKDIAGGKYSKEDFAKAKAAAQFGELESGQDVYTGLELTGAGLIRDGKPYQLDESAQRIGAVTEEQVKSAAADLLKFRASVSTVGDLFQLPYAEELGLQV